MLRLTPTKLESSRESDHFLSRPVKPDDVMGMSAFHAFGPAVSHAGGPSRVALGDQSMVAPTGRSDVLAALRAERHDLLQKRRLGGMSALDAVLLTEVEKAMERIQKPEIEAVARRDDALFERLETAVRALTGK